MEPKVPQSIKERIIKQWLRGIARDQIAEDNEIGAGTVSAIIKDTKQKDIPDIDLLREVALLLKNKDLDLVVLADSIRLKKKLDDMDLSEDQIESLIETCNIHCFKRSLKAEEFVNIINKVVALSQSLGIPVEQLPHYITQEKLELEKVKGETEDAKEKQDQVLQYYNVTMNDLEEYKRNIPLIDYITQVKNQLKEAKQTIINLAKELSSEQLENAKWLQKWRISS
jgi:hypothetical protein